MNNATHSVTVFKSFVRDIGDDRLIEQIQSAAGSAIGKTLAIRGWKAKRPILSRDGNTIGAVITFRRSCSREYPEASFARQADTIERKLYSRLRRYGWTAERQPQVDTPAPAAPSRVCSGIRIPEDWRDYFSHIYDRDDQIQDIMQSLRTAADTQGEMRNHLVLYGPPGCGKTETGLAVARMLGDDCVLRLDATATTKAGAENLILERDVIPPVLIIEELEKVNEANLPWLLGVLDDRGEIIKTNARVGSVTRKAKMLVIATVNNYKKFASFQEGALEDRFPVRPYFPMPNRELLRKILLREVSKIPGGREEWIDPALDYALNIERTFKARRIKAIMTNGRDTLLDGSYQDAQTRMIARKTNDVEELRRFGVEI